MVAGAVWLQRPQPCGCRWARKEKFFWSQRYNKGQDWYLQHYPECPGAASKAIKGKWNVYVPLVAPQPPVFQVAADMTANVFQTTNAPARIKQAYGPLARKVSFLIMIKASAAQATRSSMCVTSLRVAECELEGGGQVYEYERRESGAESSKLQEESVQ